MCDAYAKGPWEVVEIDDSLVVVSDDKVPIASVIKSEKMHNLSDKHTASLISWAPVLFSGYKAFIKILSKMPDFDLKNGQRVNIKNVLKTANDVVGHIKEAR